MVATPTPRALYRVAARWLAPISSAFRARVDRRAIDATELLSRGSALVLAPHPDDDVFGCAVTIMRKLEAGFPVHVVFATDGSQSEQSRLDPAALASMRRAEAVAAASILGLQASALTFLDFTDGNLRAVRQSLEARLVTLIRDIAPQHLLVTSALDYHPDHSTLALAARAAARVSGFSGELLEYPIWYWDKLPWTHRPRGLPQAVWYLARDPIVELCRPRALSMRGDGYLERKREALWAHSSQIVGIEGDPAGAPLPRPFVEHFLRGNEIFFRVRPWAPRPPPEATSS